MKNHLTYLFLFVFLGAACHGISQDKPRKTAEEKVDALFAHVEKEGPGYVIGVIQNSEFVFQKAYGMANLEHQIPLSSRSAFNIASLSKQFTAACVALLILDGQLSLDDPVKKHLKSFPDYEYPILVKHLIYMTSGLPEYYNSPRENKGDWSSLNYFDIDTAVNASLRRKELLYEPGTKWTYSNINYMLLSKIVEQIAQKPLSQFAKERIFDPLGMTNTLINDDIFQVIPQRVNGYNYRDADNTGWMKEYGYLKVEKDGFLQIPRNSPHYGGSGVYASLEDLKKWDDHFYSHQLAGKEFYDLMHKTMKFQHDKSNDAFGLAFGDFNGRPIVWYEGGDWGFSSYMMRFPQEKITVICLSNLGTGGAQAKAHQLMDIMVDEQVVRLK